MTLKWFAGDLIKGLSSDTKPTTNLPAGYRFFETDTEQAYYWNGSSWTATLDETSIDIADLGGSLDVIKGGTGAITLTGVLVGNGTSAITTLSGLFHGVWSGAFSGTSNTLRYAPINGGNTTVTTEADVGIIYPYAVTLKRIRYLVSGNTKDANTVISFRDDSADVQSSTISAGSNTDFDSGAISTAVAANSVINWKADASASASGTITVYMFAIWEAALF
jgi:hypothetical protein